MIHRVVAALLLPLAASLPAAAQQPPPAPVLAIRAVDVVDVTTGKLIPRQTVVVRAGRIAAMGPAASTPIPAGATTLDGQGQYLIPGLWDMHIHLRNNPVDRDKPLVEENAALLDLFLVHGIVGVREMGGDLSTHVLAWRDQIRAGTRTGPRILAPGRKLDVANPAWPGSLAVTTPEEARNAVQQMKLAGADFIKVYFNLVEAATLKAVLEEAHRVSLKVTGHLPPNLSLQTALELGLDGLEHTTLQTPLQADHDRLAAETAARAKAGLRPDTAESVARRIFTHNEAEAQRLFPLLAARSFWITPTLVVQDRVRFEITERAAELAADPRQRYIAPAIWASWDVKTGQRRPPSAAVAALHKKSIKQNTELLLAAHKAGVPLLAGTDCGVANNYVLPGWSLHEELAALVKAGLTPAEALRTATINPAAWRNEAATEGSIEVGKRGDLVLLRANPLAAIGATREIEAVVQGGRLLPRSRLDAMLAATVQPRSSK